MAFANVSRIVAGMVLRHRYIDKRGTDIPVDVVPPQREWRGNKQPRAPWAPHATDWVAYVGAMEIARSGNQAAPRSTKAPPSSANRASSMVSIRR